MEKLADDRVVVRAPEPVAADLGAGETALMSVDNGTYYGLNSVGSHIWQLLAQPRRIADLCRLIAEEYALDEAQCKQDVHGYLEQLHGEGLLRLTDDAPVD